MTAGIAAYGIMAGQAVVNAWESIETHGGGEIRGFAVFTVVTERGGPLSVECQQGGLEAIRAAWAATGLWEIMMKAPLAGVITSGPDRALPLSKFLTAGRRALITGHRRPDLPGASGQPVNAEALALIEAGEAPQAVIPRLMNQNPELDAGLIGATPGALALAETRLVQSRKGRGQALREAERGGIAILYNAISPAEGLASRAAEAGLRGFDG